MAHPPSLVARLTRMIVAFFVFVAVLFGLLYVGFEVKFQPSDFYIKTEKKVASSKSDQTFYKTVGRTAPGAGIAELSKPNHLGTRYTLELAIETTRQAAEARVDALIQQGVQAYYTPVQHKGQVIFRVRRGIYENTQRASAAVQELKSQKNIDAKIVKLR